MEKYGKKEFVSEFAERYEMTKKDSAEIYDAFTNLLAEMLEAGNEVSIPNVGKFVFVEKPERQGVIPGTKEFTTYPAHMVIKFRVAKNVKDAVKEL